LNVKIGVMILQRQIVKHLTQELPNKCVSVFLIGNFSLLKPLRPEARF
jgi:hypothetical protein